MQNQHAIKYLPGLADVVSRLTHHARLIKSRSVREFSVGLVLLRVHGGTF